LLADNLIADLAVLEPWFHEVQSAFLKYMSPSKKCCCYTVKNTELWKHTLKYNYLKKKVKIPLK